MTLRRPDAFEPSADGRSGGRFDGRSGGGPAWPRPALVERLARRRVPLSRWAVPALMLIGVGTDWPWSRQPVLVHLVDTTALLLVSAGVCLRVWAASYLAGHKTATLVVDGPYSLVRNPLYLGSLLAAAGLGLAAQNMFVFGLVVTLALPYYVAVCRAEEYRLARWHGPAFHRYTRSTPLLVPRHLAVGEPATYVVAARPFRRACGDAFLLLCAYTGIRVAGALQHVVRAGPGLPGP